MLLQDSRMTIAKISVARRRARIEKASHPSRGTGVAPAGIRDQGAAWLLVLCRQKLTPCSPPYGVAPVSKRRWMYTLTVAGKTACWACSLNT